MAKDPAPTLRLDDRMTEKVLNNPTVREQFPSIAKAAAKKTKVTRRCSSCSRRRAVRSILKTDLNAVREHIAALPAADKAKLLNLLNTQELVVPYVRSEDKRRVRLKIR